MFFGNVPIQWRSKLQIEIVCSTLEAEYILLSQGTRELVTVRRLVQELNERMHLKLDGVSLVYKAWEDNIGAENLVNGKGPMISPRIKYEHSPPPIQTLANNNTNLSKRKPTDGNNNGLLCAPKPEPE